MSISLPRLNTGWSEQPGLFERFWNEAMTKIETNINNIITAQSTADTADGKAETAQASADAADDKAESAQASADAAQATADTKVTKNVGPAWADSSGTAARTAYPSYSSPVISPIPTQAEVQAVSDALQTLSQAVVAVIHDLRANGALTP